MKITALALIAMTTVTVAAAVTGVEMIGAVATGPVAAAETCPAGDTGSPPRVAQRSIASLDSQSQPDTLWIGASGTGPQVGISTASGAEIGPVKIETPSPLPVRAVVVDAEGNGDHQLIVSDGRAIHLYVIFGCRIQAAVDQAGACLVSLHDCQGGPFLFDLGHRYGNGDGVGCSDLGDGRHLVALLVQQQGGQLTVRRTEIDLDGINATLGRSDTVTANSVQDPAVTSARTISCGDITIDKDGVSEPQG